MWRLLFFVAWLAMLAVGLLVAILGWTFVAALFWFVWMGLTGSLPTP
jgi:hypothetical protein